MIHLLVVIRKENIFFGYTNFKNTKKDIANNYRNVTKKVFKRTIFPLRRPKLFQLFSLSDFKSQIKKKT